MAKIETIEVEVKAKMTVEVDDDTAYKALSVLKFWLDANPERNLEHQKSTDGTHLLNLVHEKKQCMEEEE